MKDLKMYMKINEELLENSFNNEIDGLGKLKCVSNDINYWKNLFKYDSSRSNLENFLLYRIAGAFNLYDKGKDDVDILPEVMNHIKDTLLKIPSVKKITIGRNIEGEIKERAIFVELNDGQKFFLESDVANSLMSDVVEVFNKSLIPYLEGVKYSYNLGLETFIKFYDLSPNEKSSYYKPYKYFYYYSLISRFKDIKDLEILEKIKFLEEKAKKIHTLQNMIVVPYNYNSLRGIKLSTYSSKIKIKDDLNLTIKDFEEMLADNDFSDEMFQKRLSSNKGSLNAVSFIYNNLDVLYGSAMNL